MPGSDQWQVGRLGIVTCLLGSVIPDVVVCGGVIVPESTIGRQRQCLGRRQSRLACPRELQLSCPCERKLDIASTIYSRSCRLIILAADPNRSHVSRSARVLPLKPVRARVAAEHVSLDVDARLRRRRCAAILSFRSPSRPVFGTVAESSSEVPWDCRPRVRGSSNLPIGQLATFINHPCGNPCFSQWAAGVIRTRTKRSCRCRD